MSETNKELIFSESIKAGKRIYYFDVKESRNGDRYITITESKKSNEGTQENPRVVIEKHKLFLYKEDFGKFAGALSKVLAVAQEGMAAAEVEAIADAVAQPAEGAAPEVSAAAEASTASAAPTAPAAPTASQPASQPAQPAEEPKAEKKSFLDKMKGIF